jgi:hypothetical protein
VPVTAEEVKEYGIGRLNCKKCQEVLWETNNPEAVAFLNIVAVEYACSRELCLRNSDCRILFNIMARRHSLLEQMRLDSVETLAWMSAHMKHREDEINGNEEFGTGGGYSDELTEAIELLGRLSKF